jgi:large subunit ribosomal protein L4
MADIKIFNGQGQESGSLTAPEKLSNANAKLTMVHQVMVAELAGKRQGTAKTKRRDEVDGSNAKIRRQKGTGRSRQGDKRVPHMRGGGVVHGPVPRDYSQNTPRKVRQSAFRTVLNSRLQNERIYIVEGADFAVPKTKEFLKLVASIGIPQAKLLVLTAAGEENLARSARNVPQVVVQSVGQTSVVDVLRSEALLITRQAWQELELRVNGKGTEEAA